MWNYFHTQDPDNAFKEFHQLWHSRIAGGHSKNRVRYLGRQSQRETWFQNGITRMRLKNMVPSFMQAIFEEI